MARVNGPHPEAGVDLESFLNKWSAGHPERGAVAEAVLALAGAADQISRVVRIGPLTGALGAEVGAANADGDKQRTLDVMANDAVLHALEKTSTAYFASEEEEEILTLRADGALAVAVDPLDGSSNIDTNTSIGTIFSIFPASPEGATASFFRPGSEQLAAGYVIYGPNTSMVVTLGEGTLVFVLDLEGRFHLAPVHLSIPRTTREYAINASNYRFWHEPIREFIDDCIAGSEGPRGRDFNMRWLASMVADTHRILVRGGVFLYPADKRPGYERGRLRLIYEAAPIAMLVEQAGGLATDGEMRILDKVPTSLHQRTPLVFGSAEKVERVAVLHATPSHTRARSPLFEQRGLFRS